MIINKDEVKKLLSLFEIYSHVISVQCIQQTERGKLYRGIYHIETDENAWVCRLSNEPHYPASLVEKQSNFAMLLYENGIITARKVKCNGLYCIKIPFQGKKMCVTMEEYLGEDFSCPTLHTFYDLGKILGKIHKISQINNFSIGESFIRKEIISSKARFFRIIDKAVPSIPKLNIIETVSNMHDCLIRELSKVWDGIPYGAVHGDLGIYNNLIETRYGLGIIDFNLSGDEVYLGDALSSYYSTIHKYLWQKQLESIHCDSTFQSFFDGYSQERILTIREQEYFSKIAALFDGLFYCKYAVEMWNCGKHTTALMRLKNAKHFFDPATHPSPL